MQYYDDVINSFVANYSSGFPVELAGLGACAISGGSVAPTLQPTNAPWLRLVVITGSTLNTSIGTVDSILKRELFNVVVECYLPKTSSTSTPYTPSTIATLERQLDAFMVTDGYNSAGEEGVIYSDQAEPKAKETPPNLENWQRFDLIYRYFYQYV